MAFVENPDEFLADFGVPVTQDAKTFSAIYDAPDDDQFETEGIRPQIVAKDSDLAAAPATVQGVTVTVSGQGTFKVQEKQPDGTGVFTVVYLEKVA